jgi:pimeloyl-ACP methyl ester carboxylesterase
MPAMNTPSDTIIETRQWGTAGPKVVLLHGGPGAPGYLAPVARRLGTSFQVIEPFQRKGTVASPLTVACHAADLDAVIERYSPDEKPVLVGHSWGAMLALAWAAGHPDRAASLVLIGCGTFDIASREQMKAVRRQRMSRHVFQSMQERIDAMDDPDERLKLQGKLMMQVDSYRLGHVDDEVVFYDALGHEQTWRDMLRLQDEGVYPAAFKSIRIPVLMLHGSEDPHPGAMIRDSLKTVLGQMEFTQWDHCGHYPWLEKAAHEAFYTRLIQWLLRTCA